MPKEKTLNRQDYYELVDLPLRISKSVDGKIMTEAGTIIALGINGLTMVHPKLSEFKEEQLLGLDMLIDREPIEAFGKISHIDKHTATIQFQMVPIKVLTKIAKYIGIYGKSHVTDEPIIITVQ